MNECTKEHDGQGCASKWMFLMGERGTPLHKRRSPTSKACKPGRKQLFITYGSQPHEGKKQNYFCTLKKKEKPLINSHPKRRPIWFLHSCRRTMAIQFHKLVEDLVHCQVSKTKVNWNGSSCWGMAQANYRCWKCLNGVVYQLQRTHPLKGDYQLTYVEGNDPCVLWGWGGGGGGGWGGLELLGCMWAYRWRAKCRKRQLF